MVYLKGSYIELILEKCRSRDPSLIIDKNHGSTFIFDSNIMNKNFVIDNQQTSNVPVACLGVNFNLQGN